MSSNTAWLAVSVKHHRKSCILRSLKKLKNRWAETQTFEKVHECQNLFPSYLYSSPHKYVEIEWFFKMQLEVKYCSNQDFWQSTKPIMNSPELKRLKINLKRTH